jgi:5-methylthioadenosine/S-adenosylhomocysteine deaminase
MDIEKRPADSAGCLCCSSTTTLSRRNLLLGGAALGGLASTGFLAGPAAAQTPANVSPRGNDYILRGGYIITMDGALGDIPVGDVHVRNGAIVAVGPSVNAPGAEIVDARDRIVMPGFVETHSHSWNSLFKNMRRPGTDYFPLKAAFGKHHTPVEYYRANRLFMAEALDAGITTVLNYAHNTQTPAHVDEEIRAMKESGLRGRYHYSGLDEYPTDKVLDFADMERAMRRWFGPGSGGLIEFGYGLRPAFPLGTGVTAYPQEFKWAQDRGLHIVMHAGFTPTSFTPGPAKLAAEGFAKNLIFVHTQWYTEADRETMIKNGTTASFSLGSEMASQVGNELRFQILEMTRTGVNVTLSHDATSLNPTSMFDQMRLAFNMAPVRDTPVARYRLSQTQCLEMATINGAKAMGLADKIGSLVPGKRADIITIRTDDINMVPFENGHSAVLHSATTRNVDTVIVDGRILKFGGRIIGIDVEKVRREALESFFLLRERAGGQWAPKPWEKRPA